MSALPFLIVGLGLFWALLLWARKTEEGKVHDPMWDRLLHVAERFAREYGIKNLRIVSGPRTPPGVVYLMDMDAFKLPPSPHEQGIAVDLAGVGETEAQWLYEYSVHLSMRREAARSNAVIKNLTDV